MEISLQNLASHFSGGKHLCALGNTFKNLTSATLTLQDLLYDMCYGVEKSKNLEAEDLGSGPAPAGYQLSCVILAKSLTLSEPQVAFLSYMGVYFTSKTMREKIFCKLQSMA